MKSFLHSKKPAGRKIPPAGESCICNVNQMLKIEGAAQIKSFAGLFKGRRVQRQSLWSRPAGREMPLGRAVDYRKRNMSKQRTAKSFRTDCGVAVPVQRLCREAVNSGRAEPFSNP